MASKKFTFPNFYVLLTSFISILVILNSKKIHKSYKMNFFKKLKLGYKMLLNNLRIESGSIYTVHIAMALKLLETQPELSGDVIECGTWKGGSAANLSLVCKIVGRKLKIFDSFEGLPHGKRGGKDPASYEGRRKGDWRGDFEEVKQNISKYGSIESCEFIKGWFKDTLPKLNSSVILAYVDVDLVESFDVCIKNIWPYLVESGYIFIDEAQATNYVALFYSEKW